MLICCMVLPRRDMASTNAGTLFGFKARTGNKFVPPSFPQIRPCGVRGAFAYGETRLR
jgi:hypothetical protein